MSPSNSGAAREVAPGRLANFEDSDDHEPAIALPPRRRRRSASAQPDAPAVTGPVPVRGAEATALSTQRQDVPPVLEDASAAPVVAPGGVRAAKGPEDRVRASNVHIPVALLEPLAAKCKADGLSHGEVVIVAIETAHPRLQDLIHPAATAGGSLFASRRSRATRPVDGPLTPLNYRLRQGDFDTLDKLVQEFGASSRSHLITAALTHYLRDEL